MHTVGKRYDWNQYILFEFLAAAMYNGNTDNITKVIRRQGYDISMPKLRRTFDSLFGRKDRKVRILRFIYPNFRKQER